MAKKTATTKAARRATPTARPVASPAPAAPATAAAPATRSEARAAAERSGPVKVKALMLGYYDDIRRREGDVFFIRSMKDFSKKWMTLADPREPERITTGKEELRKKHDELLRERMPGGAAPMMTDAEPDAGSNPLGA